MTTQQAAEHAARLSGENKGYASKGYGIGKWVMTPHFVKIGEVVYTGNSFDECFDQYAKESEGT